MAAEASAQAGLGWPALRALGVDGGMQYRLNPGQRESYARAGIPFYVENISRQMLSGYQTEPGLWETTVEAMRAPNAGRAGLAREPSLCSPEFAQAYAEELGQHAESYAAVRPVFYSIASEPSVTRLNAAADFDFSPAALAEFRRWMERDAYGTLEALNTAWGTNYGAWEQIEPLTTEAALARLRDGLLNFAPWMDFRDFQDYCFSKVLHDGGELIRQKDPRALAGITGALGPFAFGGWDWVRLAKSLDVVEAYDIGQARALWRDLAPGKPALAVLPLKPDAPATAAEAGRTLWSLALEGGRRGGVLWDQTETDGAPARVLLDDEGRLTATAEALRPLLAALSGERGQLLAQARRVDDGVGVLYSPASVRLHWLLEAHALHGEKWLEAWGADSSAERRESAQLRLRESWAKLLDDLGLGWRYISSAQVERKELKGLKTIVLPQTLALSAAETAALKQFAENGGRLVVDAACGHFDEHGRLRPKPALDALLALDTSREPFLPERMNPLETVTGLGALAGAGEALRSLAPIFSDKPKGTGALQLAADYHRSPVLAAGNAGTFLNLDLTDYLRWRLHPEQPKARATRELVAYTAFQDRLNEAPIDWKETRLPLGTQVTWLSLPGSTGVPASAPVPATPPIFPGMPAGAPLLLALTRNTQSRLHELGSGQDTNAAFERPENFMLVLRYAMRVRPLGNQSEGWTLTQKITGTLDCVTPSLFVLAENPPGAHGKLAVTLPAEVAAGETVKIWVNDGSAPSPSVLAPLPPQHLCSIVVCGPDGQARPYYGLVGGTFGGFLIHRVPFALNDPKGKWTIWVNDLTAGEGGAFDVEVK